LQNKVSHNFNRFAKTYDEFAVVQKEIAKRLFNRLEIINSKLQNNLEHNILELGSGTGILSKLLLNKYQAKQIIATDFANQSLTLNPLPNKICLDSHELPVKENSFEIVISNLMMQWCDIEQITKEASKVLKNDGLFLFSTFGPQTLIELGESWSKVDNNQHISTFMDMHDIGDKMLGLGFKNVVVESEIITLTYEKVMDLLIDLKNIGAQNINSKNISKSNLSQMIKNYEKFRTSGKLPATYEVIYAHGFKNIANI
jgi:malonyl-CoA O-methyltransferase